MVCYKKRLTLLGLHHGGNRFAPDGYHPHIPIPACWYNFVPIPIPTYTHVLVQLSTDTHAHTSSGYPQVAYT